MHDRFLRRLMPNINSSLHLHIISRRSGSTSLRLCLILRASLSFHRSSRRCTIRSGRRSWPLVTLAAPAGSPSVGPSSGSPLLLLQALNNPSTLSFSHTLKLPLFAAPDIETSSTSAEDGPMIAIEVFWMVRNLSCWRVSCSADRPWLISSGRVAIALYEQSEWARAQR